MKKKDELMIESLMPGFIHDVRGIMAALKTGVDILAIKDENLNKGLMKNDLEKSQYQLERLNALITNFSQVNGYKTSLSEINNLSIINSVDIVLKKISSKLNLENRTIVVKGEDFSFNNDSTIIQRILFNMFETMFCLSYPETQAVLNISTKGSHGVIALEYENTFPEDFSPDKEIYNPLCSLVHPKTGVKINKLLSIATNRLLAADIGAKYTFKILKSKQLQTLSLSLSE